MSSNNKRVILMDTCLLIEFLNNDDTHYDISALKALISDGYLFTITPYTLYEYLAKVDEKIYMVLLIRFVLIVIFGC